MKKYETKPVMREKKILKEVICDTCETKVETDIYFSVTTRHARWGNDSIDSIEHQEFCSYPCLRKHMDEYFKDPVKTLVYDIEVEETP